MGVREWWRDIQTPKQERQTYPLSLQDYVSQVMTYQGLAYPLMNQTLAGEKQEKIGSNFVGLSQGAYKSNGVVFACMMVRFLLFSEARFQFRQIRQGRPGDLFGTQALGPLEHPWRGGTTGDLLSKAIIDVDLAGNFFCLRSRDELKRLRPDWMTIVLGSLADPDVIAGDLEAEVIGYIYSPGGRESGRDPVALDVAEVAHFAPYPDPEASYRGMSWLNPIVTEIMGDKAASQHKLTFFEHGATPNLVVMLGPQQMQKEKFETWVEAFEDKHKGLENAYKTLYLAGGADAKVIGTDLRQMDFKVTQGAGETRIAAAAGIHPSIVGLSEGLQGSSLNEGNFTAARRLTADKTFRPLWRNFASSMSSIIDVPPNSELWYDDRDIPFLREDINDQAVQQKSQAEAINILVMAGFEAASAVDAIVSGDFDRLKHTGLTSVQMSPPMTQGPAEPAANGNGQPKALQP